MKSVFAFLLLASTTLAADPQIHRDMAYAEPKNDKEVIWMSEFVPVNH